VLSVHHGQRLVVAAADGRARELGIHSGLALTQAQARVPGLMVEPADPESDAKALDNLAAWALRRYSPFVAIDAPDGLLIDITGAAHLHGGEKNLCTDLRLRLEKASIAARIGLADSYGAAHALARFAFDPVTIAAPGDLGDLNSLPIAALRLDLECVASLRRLGIESIGDLAAMSRAPLALRFGTDPGRRLDQAFGRLAEPVRPACPAALIHVRRAFAEPLLHVEALESAITVIADEMCRQLDLAGLGVRQADLLFRRVDNLTEAVRIGTAKPLRDARRLARLLAEKLETVDPGFGVEEMTLIASLAEPLSFRQTDALGDESQADLAVLVDNLANRLGANKLYRIAPVESDLPERSLKPVRALAPSSNASWQTEWPRPSRLLSPPEPVETMALLPDHPPVQFTWRGVRRRIARADGPERIFGEWWRRDSETEAVRDYFMVEDESGERFWLFRRGDGADPATGDLRWYIHGVFA